MNESTDALLKGFERVLVLFRRIGEVSFSPDNST